MQDRAIFRLNDIVDAIDQIELLLNNKCLEDLSQDRALKAAFERFPEILREASRHVPDALKSETPDIAWRRVADIGNHLRHAYHKVDNDILWLIHADGELARIKIAIAGFLARPQ